MLQSPKNKKELLDALKSEKDFNVLLLATGKAHELIADLRKLGSRQVTVVVLARR
jgi:vacuolar-type H+-ATPase subunit F/Vma7